jgi:hypothetical protein
MESYSSSEISVMGSFSTLPTVFTTISNKANINISGNLSTDLFNQTKLLESAEVSKA